MKLTNESIPVESLLILAASKGDLDAFNDLVLKYQDLIFSRAYDLLGDCHSAEDAAQESFLRAFQNIRTFQGCSFRAWLFKIVTNLCYDEMRKYQRHPIISLSSEENAREGMESPTLLADPSCAVQGLVEQSELLEIVNGFLGELPEMYRDPITLIDFHDLNYSEAAELLEIPMGTLKSRLARARFQMKEKLQRTFEYPESIRLSEVSFTV